MFHPPQPRTSFQARLSPAISAFDLASKLDELVGLGSGGGAADMASEPAALCVSQWWAEFSRHLLQTDAESSEPANLDIPTDAADASILDACVHYLRAVHLVDFYTGKTGGSVLDLCRTVGPRPPCRQLPPEQQPDLAAVMSKAKALLHTHRPHLSSLAASREFSRTPDTEGATLANFLQDWERLYPEVCVRAQPPPLSAFTPGSTPSPRLAGRGQTFLVHSPQALAAFISQKSNMIGRSPRKPARTTTTTQPHAPSSRACCAGASRSVAGCGDIRGSGGQRF